MDFLAEEVGCNDMMLAMSEQLGNMTGGRVGVAPGPIFFDQLQLVDQIMREGNCRLGAFVVERYGIRREYSSLRSLQEDVSSTGAPMTRLTAAYRIAYQSDSGSEGHIDGASCTIDVQGREGSVSFIEPSGRTPGLFSLSGDVASVLGWWHTPRWVRAARSIVLILAFAGLGGGVADLLLDVGVLIGAACGAAAGVLIGVAIDRAATETSFVLYAHTKAHQLNGQTERIEAATVSAAGTLLAAAVVGGFGLIIAWLADRVT